MENFIHAIFKQEIKGSELKRIEEKIKRAIHERDYELNLVQFSHGKIISAGKAYQSRNELITFKNGKGIERMERDL